jgi:hypothetical protein
VLREARSSHDGGWYDVRLTGAERWAADGSMQQVCDRGSARAYPAWQAPMLRRKSLCASCALEGS